VWPSDAGPIGYVLKRYPRLSETFIVSEILAHEAAGVAVEIFALRNPDESLVQDEVAQVRAPVHYLSIPEDTLSDALFEATLAAAAPVLPGLDAALREPGTSRRELWQAVRLACLARTRGIRHLHAHFATSAATVARVAARLAGLEYSFTAHAKDIYHREVDPAAFRRKLRGARAVVTVSDFNRAWLQQRYGPAAGRVRRIYNGLDLARFPFTPPVRREPVVLFAGRLVAKKGAADLLDAVARLAQRGAECRCEIVGAGPLRDALERQAATLGLGARVRFRGALRRSEVAAAMRRAAVVAAPGVVSEDGDRDGLPTVLLEAMALGTPCVATAVTGVPELIEHGRHGLLVPERDPSALADALARFLDDPELRVRVARAARARVERDFDIHRNAARLRALFGPVPARAPALPEGR
jgi:glycosyltransferase involved in cell wall biosynthesis